MAAGADCIDDLDMVHAGGMKQVFKGVYAAATFGHASQLAAVLRRHLLALAERTRVLDGITTQAFVDIDSLLRPVYGHAKEGASFGHTKISGRSVLRRGLSPLATTICTPTAAPVVAGNRLRAGKAGSSRGAASMVRDGVTTARAAGATRVLVRADSAFGNGAVVSAARRAGAMFSVVLAKQPSVTAAISAIGDDAWVGVRYPNAVQDPDTGAWISEAEVAGTTYTAFAGTRHEVTARLIVRRVKDRNHQDPLFPVWRYHPFLTDNDEPVAAADITHRQHAIVETLFSDLIDGPLAHLPSGLFRRQLGVDHPGRPDPQPAPRRRHDHRPPEGHPRRHPPPAPDQRPREAGPPATPSGAAPARPLAPVRSVARPVAHRVPDLNTSHRAPPRPLCRRS